MDTSTDNKKRCNTIVRIEIMGTKIQTKVVDMIDKEVKIKQTIFVRYIFI